MMSRGCHDCDCAVCDCAVAGCGGEIVLFGVRVKADPMRKCVSMNNLSDYERPMESSNAAAADGSAAGSASASADEGGHHQGSVNRERKRGVPWTEKEHKLFLLGLEKVGKGDWRGISRNYVKTRTPTQVASHAQKHFLRRNNLNRRRRRSSLFDITTDSVTAVPMEEEKVQESKTQLLQSRTQPLPPLPASNITGSQVLPFPVSISPVLIPVQIENATGNLTLGHVNEMYPVIRPISFFPIPNPSTVVRANVNQISSVDPSPLSLKLSLTHDRNQPSRHSLCPVMPSFNKGDSIISVS
ncbi:hypothetical protein RHGRI_034874 [Rhododendron griersonianum]|uniref:Transcription factor MYB1R1 n=1 Tax=Rhododendron griersonianum TaxID=479676 RepID=A0AAV6I561_9ERIC|nr:hypothetical protein RHGRI_034874 [Rhododendron griersonianum]